MRRLFLAFCLFPLVTASTAFGQCRPITSSRPRLYFPSAGYGSYPTLRDRWKAAQQAKTPEFRALAAHAALFASADPSAVYYDDVAFEQAFLYALDPVTYAAYGSRSLYFLAKAQVDKASGTFITAATNSNPVVFTAAGHGLTKGANQVTVWGGTGAWAAVNQGQWIGAVAIDADHFSVPLDSTSFGPLTGNLTIQFNRLVNRDPGRWNAPNWAAVWDWAHDKIGTALTANQVTLIQHAMEGAIQFHSTTFASNQVGGIANLVVGPMNGALQMAVALSGDAQGMDTACQALRTRFVSVVPQAYTTGGTFNGAPIWPMGRGGAFVESSEYTPEVIIYILDYLTAMQGATGEDLFPLFGGASWLAEQTKGWSQVLSPTKLEGYMYGDIIKSNQHGAGLGEVDRQILMMLAYHATRLGDATTAAYAEWWLTHTWTEAQASAQGNYAVSPAFNAPHEFLWFDPSLPATDYTPAYGLDYYADGIGLVLSKSSTASTATWVGMKAGALRGFDEDHFHADLLGFSIYRKGDWITNELMGWGNNFSYTKFHNTVVPATNQGDWYSGSNAPTFPMANGMTDIGRVKRYESASDGSYLYARGDATPAYRGSANPYTSPAYTPTINTVLRDFLYLKPDILVIADQLAYDAGHPTTSKWLLQALADPGTPSGSAFTLSSLRGTQALRVSVVHPASPVLRVVPPATQVTESGTNAGNVASQWRIEMTTGASVQAEQYMVVMQAGDSGFTPAPVTTLTGSNLHAAQFSGYVVASLSDTKASGVTRTYTYLADGPVKHIVMGLSPNTAYAVDRSVGGSVVITDGTHGPNDVTTTAGGLLTFSTLPVRLAVSPPAVSIECTMGAVGSCGGTIAVSTTPTGTPVQVISSSPWLSVTAASGPAPWTSQLTASLDGLLPGVYSSLLTVRCDPDCVGGAIAVPVAFTVRPSANGMMGGGASASRAVLLYDAPGVDACRIQYSAESGYANPLSDFMDAGGPRLRSIVLGDVSPLLPSTAYYARAVCGTTELEGDFQTRAAAPSPEIAFPVSSAPPAALGAATLRLDYGSAPDALRSTSTAPCATGCTVAITGTAGAVVYVRRQWLDSSNRVIAAGAVRPVLLQ